MGQGYHKVVEVYPAVPRTFTRRQGDWCQEGGNNTLVVMGTDRAKNGPATIDDGLGTIEADGAGAKTGAYLAVVGRKDPNGDPDHSLDDAFLYLAMKTAVDENLGTTFESDDTGPAAIIKSDHVRLAFRKNLKVSATKKATHVFFDNDHLHADIQGKVKLSLDVDGDSSSATIDVQGNTIVINSDGSITLTSNNKVTVSTKSVTIDTNDVTVNSDTAIVNAGSSAKINTPTLSIEGPGDTTIAGKLTVTGLATLSAGTVTPTLTAGATMVSDSGMQTSGQVSANVVLIAGANYATHEHWIDGVKAGHSSWPSGPPIA
jgi:hypothetical protein